ncbi:MAG: hypothetical protein JW751_10910 [Polyangiaceae bacterium]|nr:hypothetical protein [Polyangiaceae bacterium]
MHRLLTVTDTFAIKGRGLVLAPDVDLGSEAQLALAVELRRPDGSRLSSTALAQVPFVTPPNPNRRLRHVLTLPADVGKDEVPVGTQVWVVEEDKDAGS